MVSESLATRDEFIVEMVYIHCLLNQHYYKL